MSLSDHSLRRPVTVGVVAAALVVLGLVSLARLRLDFLPQMDMPFIGVWAPYPNAVPTQVEQEIARPIEEIMATLGDVRQIFSQSTQDGAFVGVVFDFGRSVDALRMEVRERLEQVRPLLPGDLRDTYLFTFNSGDIPIMVGRISAKDADLAGSYDLLERRVIRPLQRVEGVGRVRVDGIAPQEITIYLFLDKIVEHGIDAGRLFRTLNANNLDLSVGRVHDGRQRVTVRTLGQFRSLEEIGDLPAGPAGVRLRDVAVIDYSEPLPSYRRRIDGEPAVAFEIQKSSGANIVQISDRVREVLEEIRRDPALRGIEVILFFDQAEQIRNSLRSLLSAGLLGSILALAILYLFLRRLRAMLIVSTAIPLSVIGAGAFLYFTGRSLNVLTMMGLMLAVGMLVDNAIVVLEAIHRRGEGGTPPAEAAAGGAREVGLAVTASTLTSVIVFAPVVLSKGDQMGAWLGHVGITISVTLLLSLAVCLTVVPLLAARARHRAGAEEFRALTRLREGYLRLLRWTALRHPRRTGLVFIPAFLAITVLAIKVTGFEPQDMGGRGVVQDNLMIEVEFQDNVNIYGVQGYVDRVEAFLLARRDSLGVESVYSFFTDNVAGVRLYFPKQTKRGEREIRELRRYLRDRLPVLPGAKYRIGEEEESGRGAQQVSVTLFGEDTELLGELAREAQRRLSHLDGLTDVRSDVDEGRDEVRVVLDRRQAARFDLDSRALAEILGLTFRGVPLRDFQGRDREVAMGIVLEPSDRRNLDNLARLPVGYREGRPVLLDQVAHFEFGKGPQQIRRDQQRTAVTLRGNYEGERFRDMTRQVERVMNTLAMPAGYQWSFGRELRESRREQSDMGLNILLAICLVYLVMAALFESFLHPLVIMLCIPFAALGVIWTLMITHTPFNLLAMIGVVILVGIVVNNGIVLLDRIHGLRREGRSRAEAILEGCRDRFRPILMTAATTILGLTPLAFGKADIAGGYYFPLARAVMGGLATSTVLTLVVLPTFYVLLEQAAAGARRTIAWGLGRGPLPWRAQHAPGPAGAPDSPGANPSSVC